MSHRLQNTMRQAGQVIQKTFILFVPVLMLVAFALTPPTKTLADTSMILSKHTFSIGGGRLQSSNYVLHGVIGQPSIVGELSGSNHKLSAGFLAGSTVGTENFIFLPLIIR